MSDRQREDGLALSLNQRNIWNLEKSFAGTPINNISTTIRIQGRVDFALLKKSIHMVLASDASLRTRIVLRDGEPVQYTQDWEEEELAVYDFSHTGPRGILSWERAVSRELIPVLDSPLYRFILFRTGEDSGGVFVKLHHIISDGWSQVMLCNKISRTYLDLLEGDEPQPAPAPDYRLHVEEQQKYLASRAYEKDREYWQRMVETGGQASALKTVPSAAVSPVGRRVSFQLPEVLNHAVYSFCTKNRVAPFSVFYMALAIYFKRMGGENRFTIGVPVLNRTNFVSKQSTGMFVSTLPFFNEIHEEWSLKEFNTHLVDAWFELLRHQRFPYSDIARMAGRRKGEEDSLFHVVLSYQDSKIMENHDTRVTFDGRWHYSGYQSEQLCIHVSNREDCRRYSVDYDYLTQLFEEDEIRLFHERLMEILGEALTCQDKPIHQLSILPLTERERVLYGFNRTEHYVRGDSVYEAFLESVETHPDRAALIYDGRRVSYRMLQADAVRISDALRSACAGFGGGQGDSLAAVLLDKKPELFASMMGILRAGGAWILLPPSLPVRRIEAILAQSGAQVLITDRAALAQGGLGLTQTGQLCDSGMDADLAEHTAADSCTSGASAAPYGTPLSAQPQVVLWDLMTDAAQAGRTDGAVAGPTDQCTAQADPAGEAAKVSRDSLAYVVYTSGSTGRPKGVEITQENLLNLSRAMEGVYGQGAVLSVCSIGFDAFMLESAVALLNGRTIVIPLPGEQESPADLARLIRGYAVGTLSLTPSRLMAFLHNPEFCRSMGAMECVICGGEAFPGELLTRVKECSRARVYNQYGPSETTVGVCMKELTGAGAITAGRPMDNCRLYVLDKWMNPLPVGVYGELYVGGLCVGRGYRGQEALSAERFMDDPFCLGGRMYRTGDLACWNEDGEILLSGRMDNQVKLRGLRIELTEVSDSLAAHPRVKAAAARVCRVGGQDMLTAYYCADSELSDRELISHMASYLPRYMLPAYVLRVPEIPLTQNGKVDEKKLPLPRVKSGRGRKNASGTEGRILEIFREVLKNPDLNTQDDYFLNGGDSLNAMETLGVLEERLGCRVRIADLFVCRTAGRLAAYLEGAIQPAAAGSDRAAGAVGEVRTTAEVGLTHAPKQEYYPLTPVQEGIYIQSVLDPQSVAYNMPGSFCLADRLDAARLEAAFRGLIAGDDIFRTGYVQREDGVFARVAQQVDFSLETIHGANLTEAGEQFLRPFDLACPPLLRAGLWEAPNGSVWLFMDSHHMIGDGMSTPLVLKRLGELYEGSGAGQADFTYLDYVWSKQNPDSPAHKDHEECCRYWQSQLKELPESLELPTDYTRPHPFDYKGAVSCHVLSETLGHRLDAFARERGYSVYTLFLAAYGILLAEVSGKRQMVVGTPVSGRRLRKTAEICGPFINTLPVLLKPQRELTVDAYLEQVQETVAGMLDHSDSSPDEIISLLKLPRSLGENPLYQVMLSMRPFAVESLSFAGRQVEYSPISTGSAKSELTVEVAFEKGRYELNMEYGARLFAEETVAFYGRCLEAILGSLTAPGAGEHTLDSLRLMQPADRQRLIDVPNHTSVPFLNMPMHQQVELAAELYPDRTAIIFHGESTTYRQLEEMACRLAGGLKAAGAKKGERIAIAMKRTPMLHAAILAILKNGCTYVPFLTKFPEERIRYMMETSGADKLFCDEASMAELPESLRKHVVLARNEGSPEFESVPLTGEDILHILFTSGSTGRPKGVMIRHRNMANLLSTSRTMYAQIDGPMVAATTYIFDIFASESLIPLALGKTIALADEEEMLLPWELGRLIRETKAQYIQFTSSRLQMCLTNEAFCDSIHDLRFTIVCAEPVSEQLVARFKKFCPGRLVTMYGPTETTVYTTTVDLEAGDHVTLGRPMPNTYAYILDEKNRPVLPTGCGEICLGGEGIGAGYVGRPDLTEKLFVPDPFLPGRIMYRSGDIGRLRMDGTIDFLGRRDSQIKIDGQRVELEEVRSVMLESGLASQAVPVPVKNDDGSTQLCAFYVKEKGQMQSTPESLRAFIASRLVPYMVPSRVFAVPEIPKTASGKADMQLLIRIARGEVPCPGEMQSDQENHETPCPGEAQDCQEVRREKTSPVSLPQPGPDPAAATYEQLCLPIGQENEQKNIMAHSADSIPQNAADSADAALTSAHILSIWQSVLGRENLREDISFFEQGGSSLAALNVLSRYFNEHLNLTMTQFYEHPTARAQAELLAGASGQKPEPGLKLVACSAPKPKQIEKSAHTASKEKQEEVRVTKKIAGGYPAHVPEGGGPAFASVPQVVALTGATGFFGAHLLKELLTAGCSSVLCITRDGDRQRLLDTFGWYFGAGYTAGVSGRIRVVQGDLTKPRLGMGRRAFYQLASSCEAVFHCAADVRHYVSNEDEMLAVNAEGTKTMIELAEAGEIPLLHMSTVSVSGESRKESSGELCDFTEKDFDIGQNWQDNIYIRSKFLGEAAVYRAVEAGLNAHVFRLGRLVGRADDGVFQRNPQSNAAFLLLRAIRTLGVLPQKMAAGEVDLTPVDWCARAVLTLCSQAPVTWHMMNPSPCTLERAARIVTPDLRVVEDEAFEACVAERLTENNRELAAPLLEQWNRMQTQSLSVRQTCRQTEAALQKVGFGTKIPEPEQILQNLVNLL